MKITNDLNSNTEFLSSSNKGHESNSILGSLFTINFNSNQINPNNTSDDFEFVFSDDEIKIIDYLFNIVPNLNIKNMDTTALNKIKSDIKSDQNIESEIKDEILSFLDSDKKYDQNIFIKISEIQNIKSLSNIKHSDYQDDLKFKKESIKANLPTIKIPDEAIDKNRQKFLKKNVTSNNVNGTLNSKNELINNETQNSINKNVNFVKKVKKNEHPNKLYKLSNSKSFKSNKKMDTTSLIETKSLQNSNSNYFNDQTSDNLNKNKINEIKINDKLSNIQSSFETPNKGNQFSQQSNISLSNAGFNSILEGLLETLDLTQKGWTTKLVSRLENAVKNGGEEIEFNLKPKNLGKLKVSISLKNGIGNVKIITENSFVTSAFTNNENHLQKLFNDQGMGLEFLSYDKNQNLGSNNSFNKNSKNNDQSKFLQSENKLEDLDNKKSTDNDVSSRHIVNVIA